jgi:hypothetical protein
MVARNLRENTGGKPPKIWTNVESRIHKTRQCQQVQKHVPLQPSLVLKRERHTLNVLALSQYSIIKKIKNKIWRNTWHCTGLPGYYWNTEITFMCAFNEIWKYTVQFPCSGTKIFIRPQFYCNLHTRFLPCPAITTWTRHKVQQLLFKYPLYGLQSEVSITMQVISSDFMWLQFQRNYIA